jgi:hypothetical protein
MRTIQELLADKPEALAHVENLIAKHDVWIVGGAARALMYPMLPFPTDIDLMIDITTRDGDGINAALNDGTGSGEQGQKQTVGGVQFDVWPNKLLVWLKGVPCHGDGLAIRLSDHFALLTEHFARGSWSDVSPTYAGKLEYLTRHQASLVRDSEVISAMFADDLQETR